MIYSFVLIISVAFGTSQSINHNASIAGSNQHAINFIDAINDRYMINIP